jgi:hypothetical protein
VRAGLRKLGRPNHFSVPFAEAEKGVDQGWRIFAAKKAGFAVLVVFCK